MADKLPLHNKAGLMVWNGTAWVNASADATGKLEVVSSGGGGGGGAVTIADGDDAAEGATTDVAVTGDNSGTVSAKVRGLNKIWANVWDSINGWFKLFSDAVAKWQYPVQGRHCIKLYWAKHFRLKPTDIR